MRRHVLRNPSSPLKTTSWREIELLRPPRRIGLPAHASRALPVELARAKAAVVAAVPGEPARLALHEVAHEFEVVPPLGRRGEDLRLEQLVEPEQRRRAAQLVAHQPIGGVRSVSIERRLKDNVEQVERRVGSEVAPQERKPGRGIADGLKALQEPVRHESEERGLLSLDALPVLDRRAVSTGCGVEVPEQDARTHALPVGLECLLQQAARFVGPRVGRFDSGHLATELGDLLLPRLAGFLLERPRDVDCSVPLLLLLVNHEQMARRLEPLRPGAQSFEHLLSAVEQARLQIVLTELEHRLPALLLREIRTLQQILVHADRAVGLTAPSKEAAEREVEVDRGRVDFDDLDERLDRLVGLLVQQEIEAPEIRTRNAARLRQKLLDIDAGGEPAQAEEDRETDEPPKLKIHQ